LDAFYIAQPTSSDPGRQTGLLYSPFNGHFSFPDGPELTQFNRFQNVSVLDLTETKDDGGSGDNWSHKTCKAPLKSSPSTNQHPVRSTARMPFLSPNQQCQSTEGKRQHIGLIQISHQSNTAATRTGISK